MPDFANIALQEEAGDLVRDVGSQEGIDVGGVLGGVLCVVFKHRRPGVFVETTDAADGLVVVLHLVLARGHVGTVGAGSGGPVSIAVVAVPGAAPQGAHDGLGAVHARVVGRL